MLEKVAESGVYGVTGLPILNPITGPWVAGGMARQLALGEPITGHDIDVWFRTTEQLLVFRNWLRRAGYSPVFNSEVTYEDWLSEETAAVVQLITSRFYWSAQDCIDEFAITAGQFVDTGEGIYAEPQAVTDAVNRHLRILRPEFLSEKLFRKYTTTHGYTCVSKVPEVFGESASD